MISHWIRIIFNTSIGQLNPEAPFVAFVLVDPKSFFPDEGSRTDGSLMSWTPSNLSFKVKIRLVRLLS